jgi:hypothetical protein
MLVVMLMVELLPVGKDSIEQCRSNVRIMALFGTIRATRDECAGNSG